MKFRRRSLIALFLACTLVIAVPAVVGGSVRAVDLDSACTLTVHPGGAQCKDINEANVVIDLYRVADAAPVEGYDTYTYTAEAAYAGLDLTSDHDSDGWNALAEQAAAIALGGKAPVANGVPAGKTIDKLSTGLYLVIARGADVKDYVVRTKTAGSEHITTIARTATHIYSYSPVLVSLPTKDADKDGKINTANPGAWVYDGDITLKPEQDLRYGSLEIVKSITDYVIDRPATFVFEIEAVLDGKNVYSDVVSIDFSKAGKKSVIIKNIPAGATVTVTEVYSGAVYNLVTDGTKTALIEADKTASVSFTNRPGDDTKDGGSITNKFTYSEGGWAWTPISNDH